MKIIRELSFLPKVSPVLMKLPHSKEMQGFGETQQRGSELKHSDREVKTTKQADPRNAGKNSDSTKSLNKALDPNNSNNDIEDKQQLALLSNSNNQPKHFNGLVDINRENLGKNISLRRYQIQGTGKAIHSFLRTQEGDIPPPKIDLKG